MVESDPWLKRYALRANGLPSESRQMDQRSPGWMISPPSSVTRSSVAAMSSTAKYGERDRVARPFAALVEAKPGVTEVGFPARAVVRPAILEAQPEHTLPEGERAFRLVPGNSMSVGTDAESRSRATRRRRTSAGAKAHDLTGAHQVRVFLVEDLEARGDS